MRTILMGLMLVTGGVNITAVGAAQPVPTPSLPAPTRPAPASAEPAIDPAQWRGEISGEPSRILNIGSAHLGQMTPLPTADLLTGVIDRLVAFRPDIITQEGVSGEQCEAIRATPAIYGVETLNYCWDLAPVFAVTGIAGPAARTAIEATLANWPQQPTATDRRRLISLFLSASDRTSALVQWLQLPLEERRSGDGLEPALAAIMADTAGRMNERYALAAVVAARLGLARVYPVDDHSADAILTAMPAQCAAAINTMWQSPASLAVHTREEPLLAAVTSSLAMLGYYRYMNNPATQRSYIDVDHRAAVGSGGAGDCGRRYVAWWETRNLRMVANIRAAMGSRPGARVLNIVGASHKPYYDLYLSRMADAVIVDAGGVLGTP